MRISSKTLMTEPEIWQPSTWRMARTFIQICPDFEDCEQTTETKHYGGLEEF